MSVADQLGPQRGGGDEGVTEALRRWLGAVGIAGRPVGPMGLPGDAADLLPAGLFATDADGIVTYVNRTLAEWLGEDAAAVIARAPRERDVFVAAAAEPDARRHMAQRADGVPPIAVTVDRAPIDAADGGGSLGVVQLVRDSHDWRADYEALDKRFGRFFDLAPVGIATLGETAEIVECNAAFRRLLGAPRSDGPFPLATALEPKDAAGLAAAVASLAAGESEATEIDVRLAGESEDRAVHFYLTRAGDEADREVVVHAVDITERLKLEAQFTQSQKMQAVGQLAGGIAHDFNNLLTAMIGFCDLLLLRHRPGEESFADIMHIKQNANRAANLVRQLLAFSRQQTLAPKVLNITDVVAELSYLLRRLLGESIELDITHGRDLGLVRVDQGQLEQVIINLAVNARDAMPDGGALSIRTANVTVDDPVRRGDEVMQPGDYVLIEVADDGTGIEPENIERIFEPFFSTKEIGAGTGLGLSTVYGIIRQTGGFVFVDSNPGEGARFRIFVPVHDPADGAGPEPGAAAEDDRARDLTGHGTVMLVEDEDAVRMFGARALRNKGYTVIEASGGANAMSMLDEHLDAVDVLVTDVVMPGMDGPALIQEIRARRPDIKVICISGYAEDAVRRRLDAAAEIHFLAKPFSLAALAAKVKEVLRAAPRE